MLNPLPGRSITTPFGRRGRHWSCNRDAQGMGQHSGSDWAAPNGTPIVAPIAGTIRHRAYGTSFGPHQFAISPSAGMPFANGELFFAHTLDRPRDGTVVQPGQQISRVGALGNATGPHLHMELFVNTKNRWACGLQSDPAPHIRAAPRPPDQPQPPPQPAPVDEGDDTMFVARGPDGAAFLIMAATRKHGIHDGADLTAFSEAGIPVVNLTLQTFNAVLTGRA